MLVGAVGWIGHTPFSVYLQNLHNMVPIVQTLHIFAIAALFSSSAVIDLRVLRLLSKDRPLAAVFHRFEPGIWMGLPVLLLTGALLIVAEPGRALLAWQFWTKMTLILAGIAVTLLLRGMMKRTGADAVSPVPARALAVVSLLIWVAVIAAGRWIAYR